MTLVLTANFGSGSSVRCLYEDEAMELENALLDSWVQSDNIAGQHGGGSGTKRKQQHEEAETEDVIKRNKIEDTDQLPKRRVPLLWSPRMRWKDERRKVLKMSVNKLRRIEDPESYLRRSVLINNTVRKLQMEIRQERNQNSSIAPKKNWGFDSQPPEDEYPKMSRKLDADKDDVSCDEIFGVHEDFLRINLPEKCPIATTTTTNTTTTSDVAKGATTKNNRTRNSSGGTQCATQYRTVQDFLGSDSRQVSHFDNVVYHSLLASLES